MKDWDFCRVFPDIFPDNAYKNVNTHAQFCLIKWRGIAYNILIERETRSQSHKAKSLSHPKGGKRYTKRETKTHVFMP